MHELIRTRIGVMTFLAPMKALTDPELVEELRVAVAHCLDDLEIRLVVDLAQVNLLNGAAVEALLDAHDQLVRFGGWLKVTNVNPINQDIFRITRFDQQVATIDSEHVQEKKPLNPHWPRENLRLGDLLIKKALLKPDQVSEAMRLQKKLGKRMGQIIVDKGWVSERDFLTALGEQLGIPFVALRAGLYDPEVAPLMDKDVARRLRVLPLFKVRGKLFLATADPQDIPSRDEVEERTGHNAVPVLARQEDILKATNDAYSGEDYMPDLLGDVDEDFEIVKTTLPEDYTTIDEKAAGSPVVNLVNSIIQRAVSDGASDVHIEASRTKSRIRFRIDGVLYEVMNPPLEIHPALLSRLKVMANLDIAERRLPQDGRIQVYTQGRSVDLRFSSMPGLCGEKVVLRVLDKNQSILDLHKLGISKDNLNRFKALLEQSYGLILVTGPTGSGKTTTLYAALNHLNSMEKNIVTIEDPVEYQVEIVNQSEVKTSIGLTYAKMLKHVLRQDPDIIMVGEIRERETAEIAVQAALTGHLVLSTLHTNDSVGAVTRMVDMGVEPYLLSSALIGVVAQRLVRSICPSCKTTYLTPPEVLVRYGWEDKGSVKLAKGRGCPECYDSGYKGRIGIHELLESDEELQRLVIANPSRNELWRYVKERGIKTLLDDGFEHVLNGDTTIEEVTRAVNT